MDINRLTTEDIAFYLRVFKDLDLADIIALAKYGRTKRLNPGDIYIDEGSSSQKIAYIRQGLIRTYYLNDQGKEFTLMLRWEGQLVASIDSMILKKPSRFIYQALEETTVLELDYENALMVIDNNQKLSAYRYSFMLQMLSKAMERIETFVLLSPEERYIRLVEDKPDIVNRVPNKYLATLLGINPVSLSRIRKRISTARKR